MINYTRKVICKKKEGAKMPTVEVVIQAISSLGFPIIVAIALFWYITKKDEQHREEIKSLKESIDKNSSVLDELKGLITFLVGELKK